MMKFTKKVTDWDSLPVVLDVETVCCILTTSDMTIRNMLSRGELRGNKVGKNWRVDRDSVREFICGTQKAAVYQLAVNE